jgi:hypothetical protein
MWYGTDQGADAETGTPFLTHVGFVSLFCCVHKLGIERGVSSILLLYRHCNENDTVMHRWETHLLKSYSASPITQSRIACRAFTDVGFLKTKVLSVRDSFVVFDSTLILKIRILVTLCDLCAERWLVTRLC